MYGRAALRVFTFQFAAPSVEQLSNSKQRRGLASCWVSGVVSMRGSE